MSQMHLSICGRKDTYIYRDTRVDHVLSLLDPELGLSGLELPKTTKHHKVLFFHDIDDIEAKHPKYASHIAPQRKEVEEIAITFQKIAANEHILVHCEAGISRSTAAAIIGLCSTGLTPQESFQTVISINKFALPNRRMLRIAGELMKDGGELSILAEKRRKFLFDLHKQKDPIELLNQEILRKGKLRTVLERTTCQWTSKFNKAKQKIQTLDQKKNLWKKAKNHKNSPADIELS